MNEKKVLSNGWDAITEVFDKIYNGAEEYLHFGTMLSWEFGGKDPLRGISIYDAGDYYHFVTYGFSELYEKVSDNKEYSGYGFELTLKLKKHKEIDDNELKGVAGILQTLGRVTFMQGNIFKPNEYLYTGQKTGMDIRQKSKLTSFITLEDQDAGTIITDNGKVQFVQIVGVTDKEINAIMEKRITVQELLNKLGNSYTDYKRKEIKSL